MEEKTQPAKAPKNKKWRWLKWLLALIVAGLAIGGGYEYYQVHQAASKVFSDNAKVDKKLRQGKPITILTLGLDSGALGRKNWGVGNTDAI